MSFQLSPGVNVTEIDLTAVIPSVATTDAAIGGVFRWGPVEKAILVTNEDQLVARFGRPTNLNAETFFTAASFLAYSDSLYVSRAVRTSGDSAVYSADLNAGNTTITVSNAAGVLEGFAVFGPGIKSGTVVTSIDGNELVLSEDPEISDTGVSLQIFEADLAFNAVANSSSVVDLTTTIVKNEEHYDLVSSNFDTDAEFVAKYPGELGNSLKVSVCPSAAAFESGIVGSEVIDDLNVANTVDQIEISFVVGSNTAIIRVTPNDPSETQDATDSVAVANAVKNKLTIGDLLFAGNSQIGSTQLLQITAISNPITVAQSDDDTVQILVSLEDRYSLSGNYSSTTIDRRWEFSRVTQLAPGQSTHQLIQGNTAAQDELHVVVSDEDGRISGVPGTILEVYQNLSRATDSKTLDGASNYYEEVINESSKFIWFANDFDGNAPSVVSSLLASSALTSPYTQSFVGGRDSKNEETISVGDLINAYNLFESAETVDISLILAGKARGGSHGEQVANYLVDNIAEKRKDCIVLLSPDRGDVINNTFDIEAAVIQFRNAVRSTSYAVMDSGYKYMYDKYNDIYRYIPLNGDIGGLCARTDDERDAWFSPAGFNRGQIRNIVKLAWNPKQAERDLLYKNGINSVVNFPGQGIILFGDKTLLSKPSAFDRINVRRLFIVLEKAIARASQSTLFEFNDEFTRSSFVNLVTPFLRGVQGRRGITDFAVICDETNNTGEVIDRNEFIGDIYIKPARAINFIQLNFVAVRTGVEFSEIIGQF